MRQKDGKINEGKKGGKHGVRNEENDKVNEEKRIVMEKEREGKNKRKMER